MDDFDCDYEPVFEESAYEMYEDELNAHECNELDRDREAGEFDDEEDDLPEEREVEFHDEEFTYGDDGEGFNDWED